MSSFAVEPDELTTAGLAAQEAATTARGRGGQAAMTSAGEAMPGAACVTHLSDTGVQWSDDVKAWTRATRSYGEGLVDQAEVYRRADEAAKAAGESLRGRVGNVPQPR